MKIFFSVLILSAVLIIGLIWFFPKESFNNLIMVDFPKPNEKISSPLLISGKARGFWYFEASFPVKLIDEFDNLVVQSFAQAQGEWMTENFVPFSMNLEFIPPVSERGFLVLEKDNPSGLPENAAEIRIPVLFR